MLGVSRAADVHGGEDREDVGLQEGHQHFECREEHEHEEGQDRHRLEQQLLRLGGDERLGEQGEGHEEDVPASMLAKSRTVSENGRTMMFEMNSMTPTSGFSRRRARRGARSCW